MLGEIDGRTPATVARKLSAVSGFFRYALNEDVIARNPVAAVRRPKVGSDTQSTGLDRDELASLIGGARNDGLRSHALVLLLALNGLRISEALGADATDLDVERGHRVLRITRKGGKKSTIPLAPRTSEALDAYLSTRTTGPLFSTSTVLDSISQRCGALSGDLRRQQSQQSQQLSILTISVMPS
jgi:site-specific recombinase XerD